MAKKKNLGELDAETIAFIEEKMQPHTRSIDFYDLNFKADVKCKSQKQKEFYKQLKDNKKIINFGMGSAGTGKSMISLWYALEELAKNDKYKKIVIIIPTCEASKTLSIGYLKGDLEAKISPYQQADKHTIEKILTLSENKKAKQIAQKLIDHRFVQFDLLSFIKGKTYDDGTILLINEAEDFSKDDMLLLLTRLGEYCKIIITGDEKQTSRHDIKNKQKSGLLYATEKLKDLDEVSVTYFTDEDIVRNKLITKILQAWNEE